MPILPSPQPAGNVAVTYDRYVLAYYDNEDVVLNFTSGAAATGWTLRDYDGQVVSSGSGFSSPLNLGILPLGWYKLYFTGPDQGSPWFDSYGAITFTVGRSTSPLRSTPLAVAGIDHGGVGAAYPAESINGCRPYRIDMDIGASFAANLAAVKHTISVEQERHITEPGYARELFVQFPDGEATGGPTPTPTQTDQITQAVSELTPLGVKWYEARNEPNAGGWTAPSYVQELTAFYNTVHAAHPDAKVIGGCTVTISPGTTGLAYIEAILDAGAAAVMDALSIHVYNATNGDLTMGRASYQALLDLLAAKGFTKPLWMTEWGTFGWDNGLAEMHAQGQWTMMELHLLEQHGIPRDRCSWFYPRNNGFWAYPSMWYGSETLNCPTALPALHRTWVEETWGRTFAQRLDFGDEDAQWIGSRFDSVEGGTSTIACQSAGRTGSVSFRLTGAGVPSTVVHVDRFGDEQSLPVTGGLVTVDVTHLEPWFLRVPATVTVTPETPDYGLSVIAPQKPTTFDDATAGTSATLPIASGALENAYGGRTVEPWMTPQAAGSGPWRFGATLARPTRLDRVVLYCPPPWQKYGVPLDFDVEGMVDGSWQVLATRTDSPLVVLFSGSQDTGGNYVDTYWNREHHFVFELADPVTVTGLRVIARAISYGGVPSAQAATADGRAPSRCGLPATTVDGVTPIPRMAVQELAAYLSPESDGGTAVAGQPMLALK